MTATTLLVAILGSASAAHAETLRRVDPVGDVVRQGAAGGTRAGPRTLENTDLTRVVAKHTHTQFVIRLKYYSFSTVGFEEIYISQTLRTSAGRKFVVLVRLDHRLMNADIVLDEVGAGAASRCPTAQAMVHPDRLRVRWVIPRSCIGNPKWIRFRGAAGSVTENVVKFADDLLTAHAPGRRFSTKVSTG